MEDELDRPLKFGTSKDDYILRCIEEETYGTDVEGRRYISSAPVFAEPNEQACESPNKRQQEKGLPKGMMPSVTTDSSHCQKEELDSLPSEGRQPPGGRGKPGNFGLDQGASSNLQKTQHRESWKRL